MTTIKEATFRHQFLTTDKVEVLLAQLHNLKALNLSQNKMNILPRGLPSTLIALDLSYNLFATFPLNEKLHNLIELKLSNNSIESTAGLASAVSLQYLDLSNNRIKMIVGLEGIKNLKSLQLEENLISSPSALRSLSFNRNLSDLVLEGNPVALQKGYRNIISGFILSLKKLDGERCKSVGYADGYSKRRNNNDALDFDKALSKGKASPGSHTRAKPEHNDLSLADSLGESIYLDGFSSNSRKGDIDPLAPVRARSPMPWRNPPSMPPRDRRGISMLSLTGEIKSSNGILSMNNSPRRHFSADSSPVRRKKVVTTSALSASEVPDNAARGSSGSPGKGVSVTKKPEGKVHIKVEGTEKGNSPQHQQQQQQWCTPLLANNAVLKRLQAEEKIHRRLSEPLGTVAGTTKGTGTAVAVAVSLPGSPSIATKIRSISPSKDSSLRIVPSRESERGRERGRSAERSSRSEQYLRSGSRDKSRSTGRSVSPSKAHADHAGSDYSFEQEREASYLNKHLGFSSKDELWQDDLIEEALSLSTKSLGHRHNHSADTSLATTTDQFESVNLSPTLQNKSSVLRAVCTAEAIRKRDLLHKDEQMRRRSPSPVRHNIIDWDHHHSGGKTPPYHRSNFFKVAKSESEKTAAIEAERDYKSELCRISYASTDDVHLAYLNMKKKESNRSDASDTFDLSACLSRQNASMNADFMAPVMYDVRTSATYPKSPPTRAACSAIKRSPSRARSISPVRRAPTSPSPPRLRPHSPVQSHHERSPPVGQPQSLPQLRPTSPINRRSQSPPRLHCNSTPHVPLQSRPQSPLPLERTHTPPQLRASSPVRSPSPSRTDNIFTSKYRTSPLTQTCAPSPERIHYHSSQLQRGLSPPHNRAHALVQVRAQSPPPPLRPQSPVAQIRQSSSDSLDHTDVGNHSRSPTQHRVPALNKSRTSSSRAAHAHSPPKHSADISKPGDADVTRSVQVPLPQRRKQIYESALLLDKSPLPDDFHGDFKYLERLLTEVGDGSIEVRRLKTVMRTIMESRKESLQLLQSAISTSTSA